MQEAYVNITNIPGRSKWDKNDIKKWLLHNSEEDRSSETEQWWKNIYILKDGDCM